MNQRQAIHKARKLFKNQQIPQAIQLCKPLINKANTSAELWNLWGQLCIASGHHQDAFIALAKACQVPKPDWQHLFDFSHTALQLGQLDQALQATQALEQLDNSRAETFNLKGEIQWRSGHAGQALETFNKGLKLHPKNPELLLGYASVIYSRGEFQQAEEILTELIMERNYCSPAAFTTYADILLKSGRNEQACQFLKPKLNSTPAPMMALWSIYILASLACDQHHNLTAELPSGTMLGGKAEQQSYFFSLARLHEKLQDYAKAFEFFQAANALTPTSDDSEAQQRIIKAYRLTTSPQRFVNFPRSNQTSNKPIFIVGMPRSGTTLLERIISQQDKVIAGGELAQLGLIAGNYGKQKKAAYTHEIYDSITSQELGTLAEQYIQALDEIDPTARHITDKMPANFIYCGLIALMLPNAKIFHTRRKPMDVGFSCYSQNFHQALSFTNSLDAIASYYRFYAELMLHWESLLSDQIMTVQYEELVGNFNQQTQRIYHFLGFDWDENTVSSFHQNRSAVATASHAQVTRPLYNTAMEKWRCYEGELQPLYQAFKANGIDPETGDLME